MIDKETIRHIAELSKIVFDEKELDSFTEEMQDIVQLMDIVKEFKDENEEIEKAAIEFLKLREDKAERKKIKAGKNISVPRVL